MSKFSDSAQREWVLVVDVAAMRRAKKAGVDLSMPVIQMQEFVADDVFVSDAIWAIISQDAKQRGITQEQFESAMNGATFDAAREALWAALTDYYDPKSTRATMLRAAIAQVETETQKAIEKLTIGDSSPSPKEN